ncbi:hypothetical protein [Sphingobacterium sp. BN32]|uniref:hypothetical protein n=1 Tax=Sphingobacterium sp. BN32 TaxID=3058432 RepID=UPI00265CEBA1|nr:hypothetical protein [Sphingobacterium sp. BN32]WKK57293.1 hypothetical protein QYC40_11640 [Sphingobacterium sp. BN32]
MAYSQQDIYNKIGDLLVEINEQYASLDKATLTQDSIQLQLLAAQAKFLSANLDALHQLSVPAAVAAIPQPELKQHTVEAEENTFTPAPTFDEQEADSQPVIEEIQEVKSADIIEETEVVAEDPEEVEAEQEIAEQKPEGIKFEGFGRIDDSVTDNETDQEEAAVVEHLEDTVEEEQEEEKAVEDKPAEKSPEQPANPSYTHTASSNYTSVEKPTNTFKTEAPVAEEKKEEFVSEPVVNEVVIEEKHVEIPVEPKEASLNDLAKQAEQTPSRRMTLNELIQQQKQAGLTNVNQFQTSASKSSDTIVDLKTGVSLNDKLLFIKDLFNGYSLAYSEAIELLNRFDNFAEADAFLQSNYALKNNWASKPQTVDKLYVVLRKKYLS